MGQARRHCNLLGPMTQVWVHTCPESPGRVPAFHSAPDPGQFMTPKPPEFRRPAVPLGNDPVTLTQK